MPDSSANGSIDHGQHAAAEAGLSLSLLPGGKSLNSECSTVTVCGSLMDLLVFAYPHSLDVLKAAMAHLTLSSTA